VKIERVETHHIGRSLWAELWEREKDLPLVTPLSGYPAYHHPYSTWYWDPALTLVILTADDGTVGLGWTEDGVAAARSIIDRHLARFVRGASPFDVERLWDVMYRASVPYGRAGSALEAIAALDIALWDLMGRATSRPVYELLGGACRDAVPLYASALHPVGPEKVAAEVRGYVAAGYRTLKGRFPCGPADGLAGMRENEAHVRTMREAAGPDVAIAADAYMGWDAAYARAMCRRLEPYDLAWIEEPVLPDDVAGYAAIRRSTRIPIAGGEHEFTRWGFARLFEAGAVDIAQPDLHRCGGFTEGRRIAAMAAARGLSVINHTYSLPHVHFAMATANCPMLEHFPSPAWAGPLPPERPLFVGQPVVTGAAVRPPDRPGLGVILDRERLRELTGRAEHA
jgi:L-alanine-DL-glutamate epimerase-like enolase superfamily enzyme